MGKWTAVFRQISPYASIIQPFGILIGRFQNLLNKTLRKSLIRLNVVKIKVAEFVKIAAQPGVKSFIICQR